MNKHHGQLKLQDELVEALMEGDAERASEILDSLGSLDGPYVSMIGEMLYPSGLRDGLHAHYPYRLKFERWGAGRPRISLDAPNRNLKIAEEFHNLRNLQGVKYEATVALLMTKYDLGRSSVTQIYKAYKAAKGFGSPKK